MPNDYDRILKENMGAILRSVSAQYLGFKIVSMQDVPGKLQKTLEREPDFVKMVKTDREEEFLLHLEFQVTDDLNMLTRMRTYHALLAEKYQLPIRQFVLYLGRPVPKMETRIPPSEVMYGFHLLDLQRMDADQFLRSEIPEEIILAILANFGDRPPIAVIRLILSRLRKVEPEQGNLEHVIQQLGILARINKLDSLTFKAIEEMPITIDIEKDAFYLKGMERRSESVAINMIRKGIFSDEMICEISGVSMARLEELKQEVEK